jgi:protein SCO1/2
VRSRRAAAVLAVLAVLSTSGCAGESPSSSKGPVADVSINDTDGLNGTLLPKPYRVPDIALEDTTGKQVALAASARKSVTLVFFGYTHCPDICQVVMATISSALVRLSDEERSRVDMAFVTTDPRRDTPQVLRAYLDRFDPGFRGLTGDLSRIVRLGAAFDVEITKGHKLASGGYDVAHGTQVVGVRPDRTAPLVWTEGTAPEALADDLEKILDDKVTGL